MKTAEQIRQHLDSLPEPKRRDLEELHGTLLELMPGCKLWFLDGRDESGKVVSNPSIGYGSRALESAQAKGREFYQVGISANTAGISVYIFGFRDKGYLLQTFGERLGKAKVSGYCIKLRKLADVNLDALKEAIRQAIQIPSDAGTNRAEVASESGDGTRSDLAAKP